MSENKYSFLKVNFERHDAPVFKEVKDGELVIYGDKVEDPYPDYLIDLAQKSARHGAILKAKTRYIAGNGWAVDEFGKSLGVIAEIQRLVQSPNQYDSLDELTNKITSDLMIFGGFAIECVWNKAGTKIAEFSHVPFALVRALKVGKDKYKYCYLPDWKKVRKYEQAKEKEGFKEWDILSPNGTGSQILYITEARPIKSGESAVYPIPDYVGAIKLIEADSEIANFRLNNVKNGFWASKIIIMRNGVPDPEQQQSLKRDIIRQHTGSDNAGSFALMFTDSPQNDPASIIDLTGGDLDKQFIDVDKAIETAIFTGHGVTSPTLMGVATPGALGQRGEMMDAYELFYSNYIVPKQKIIEDAINYIYSFNNVEAGLKLNAVKPLNIQFSEQTLTTYLDQKEMRALIQKSLGLDLQELKKGKFSSDVDTEAYILGQFSGIGTDADSEDIIGEFDIEKDEFGKYQPDDYYVKKAYAKTVAAPVGISEFEAKVLQIIRSNPKVTPEEMAQALETSLDNVQSALGELIGAELVTGDVGDYGLGKGAAEAINESDVQVRVGVKYRYNGPKDSRNRKFCANLLSLNKLYTRAEIDGIRPSPNAPDETFSVFDYRGGFWRHKDGEITPYCRHTWKAVAVRLK